MNGKKTCPQYDGYGEIMKRDKYIDSDGSEDIGNTSYISTCPRCKGEGEISYDPNTKLKRKIKAKCYNCKKEGLDVEEGEQYTWFYQECCDKLPEEEMERIFEEERKKWSKIKI